MLGSEQPPVALTRDQLAKASLNQWAYRTPVKPRPMQLDSTGAAADGTPATMDTIQSDVVVESPLATNTKATCDSTSPYAQVLGGPALTATRPHKLTQDLSAVHLSPTYNTCAAIGYRSEVDTFSSARSSRFLSSTPQASACRFKFSTRPIDLFKSSPDTKCSGDSCWVNVSPSHKSILLYSTGLTDASGCAAGAVILGPDNNQEVAFRLDGGETGADRPLSPPNAVQSPDAKLYLSQSSTISNDTPVPTRAGQAELSTSKSDRAALAAAIAGLESRSVERWKDDDFSRIVIATDCKYVVTGACDWLTEWSRNGWHLVSHVTRAESLPTESQIGVVSRSLTSGAARPQDKVKIPDADLWQELEAKICKLRNANITVEFLHIPIEWNSVAVNAARSAK